jgi:hypothetical protein
MSDGIGIIALLVIVGLVFWLGRRSPHGGLSPGEPGSAPAGPPRSHSVTPYAAPDEDFYTDEDEFAVFADEGEDDE